MLAQYRIKAAAIVLCTLGAALSAALIAFAQPSAAPAPTYTADGRLEFPKPYRTWVYLSSGLDMSYLANVPRSTSTFGNVFVNPGAYDAFLRNGTWPDKTVLVLEVRSAEQNGSINKSGRF